MFAIIAGGDLLEERFPPVIFCLFQSTELPADISSQLIAAEGYAQLSGGLAPTGYAAAVGLIEIAVLYHHFRQSCQMVAPVFQTSAAEGELGEFQRFGANLGAQQGQAGGVAFLCAGGTYKQKGKLTPSTGFVFA